MSPTAVVIIPDPPVYMVAQVRRGSREVLMILSRHHDRQEAQLAQRAYRLAFSYARRRQTRQRPRHHF